MGLGLGLGLRIGVRVGVRVRVSVGVRTQHRKEAARAQKVVVDSGLEVGLGGLTSWLGGSP